MTGLERVVVGCTIGILGLHLLDENGGRLSDWMFTAGGMAWIMFGLVESIRSMRASPRVGGGAPNGKENGQ